MRRRIVNTSYKFFKMLILDPEIGFSDEWTNHNAVYRWQILPLTTGIPKDELGQYLDK